MTINKALLATVLGATITGLGFSQQYPQYPQGQQQQQQYPPDQQQSQYPQQYPQQQYPPAQSQYPAQQYPVAGMGQPPLVSPQQLDQMVASIALYPDGLLAHVLTASTVYQQIPEAAGWANQHAFLHGQPLAAAIQEDHLPWDVSVLSLLPFPQVLSQMAQYMQWTQQLGDAVLAQRGDVMDAIQRLRMRANQYGYFQDPQFARYERVDVGPGAIRIDPIGADYFVPYYSPQIFFGAPRRGVAVGFSFGPAVSIGGGFFSPWGWGGSGAGFGFGWREHSIVYGGNPWNRGWNDRPRFDRPYVGGARFEGPRVEQHGYAPARREEFHREERRDERRGDRRDERPH